jgi:hypothetical protein
MDDDYGKKVGQAVQAVMNLHSDIGRLFGELDKTEFKGWESIFGPIVTKNVPKDVKKHWWMPYFVFRYYRKTKESPTVEGATCYFFSGTQALTEPQFLVSQVLYKTRDGKPVHCGEWDVLKLFQGHESDFEPGKVISVAGEDESKFQSARLVVVPLYSIRDRKRVTDLIERVRQKKQGPNGNGC